MKNMNRSVPDPVAAGRLIILATAAVLVTAGCGDGTEVPTDTVVDNGPVDVVINPDYGNDSVVTETTDDVTEDTNDTVITDTSLPDSQFDLTPDEDPPHVVSTYPENDETGVSHDFTVRITFNEGMREVTMKKDFIKLYDIGDSIITGSITYDPVSFTVSFTPDSSVTINQLAPYTMWISDEVQDTSGNTMSDEYTFYFATAGPEQMDGYEDLAVKYSPTIYQETDQDLPQLDFPTRADFDQDWNVGNNSSSIAMADEVPINVYYDVIETTTHYFIRYHYFYVNHEDKSRTFGNEVIGVMVVVQKSPEAPIAAETYFGNGSFEDIRSFVTTDSGLVLDDDGDTDLNDSDRKNYNVNWVFPKAELFPGGHFQSFVTSKSHESCAWIQTNRENSLDFKCLLSVQAKPDLKIMHFAYTGDTTNSISAPFPTSNAEGNEVGYSLRLAVEDWWVRRDRTGPEDPFSSTATYDAPEGLIGDNLFLPRAFRSTPNSTQGGGKTPWCLTWDPALTSAYNYFHEFNEGTFYIHPAYYFAKRHRLTLSDDNTGLSGVYCYNPYLFQDKRGLTAECSTLD